MNDTGELETPSYSTWSQQPAPWVSPAPVPPLFSGFLSAPALQNQVTVCLQKKTFEEILNKFWFRKEGILKRLRNL